MPVHAIIFDLFDTLVDLALPRMQPRPGGGRPVHSTAARLHEALSRCADVPFERFVEALREVDRTHMVPRIREGRELPTLERFGALAEWLGVADPALPGILTDVHMGLITEHVTTPDHHPATLARLRRRAALGICSNFTHAPTARSVVREAGLAPLLDAVVISEEVGFRKPRREMFEATLAALSMTPEETLHVGDDLAADVAGAAALGIRTVWITRRVARPEAARRVFSEASPDFTIDDLSELEPLLDVEGPG